MAVVDWDRDGDPDLVVGTIDGQVQWLSNTGTVEGRPTFGKPTRIIGFTGHDAGPLVVDWDEDGVQDLLVGSGDGAIRLFIGTSGAAVPSVRELPELEKAAPHLAPDGKIELIRDKASGSFVPNVDRSEGRSKPAACDWNGDGLLDLLVGDFVGVFGPEPELTAGEQEEKTQVELEESSMSGRLSTLSARLHERARYENGVRDHRKSQDEALEERIDARLRELERADVEYQGAYSTVEKLMARRKELSAPYYIHGYVWVYLRRPKAETR